MDTLFVAIGLVGFIVIVLLVFRPTPPEPQIIYIQTAPPPPAQEAGIGCAPIVSFSLLAVLVLAILRILG